MKFTNNNQTFLLVGFLLAFAAICSAQHDVSDSCTAEILEGDLSSNKAIVNRLHATLVAAKGMMKVDSIGGAQMKNALKTLTKGIQSHPEFMQRKLLGMDQVFNHKPDREEYQKLKSTLPTLLELAELAYTEETDTLRKELKHLGYELNRHHQEVKAGVVGYYVALDDDNKELLFGVKGTSSVADALTDCVAVTMDHTCLPMCPFASGDKERKIRCHEGILTAALTLAEEAAPIVEELAIQKGYTVKIVGHSLGAGTAALLGVLLRAGTNEKLRDPNFLKVWAFAAPPVLDIVSAEESKSFVTTIVNKADIVPRLSIANLEILAKILSAIAKELEAPATQGKIGRLFAGITGKFNTNKKEKEAQIEAAKAATAEGRSLSEAMKAGDSTKVMALSFERMVKIVEQVQSNLEIDSAEKLYVPGRVITIYEKMDAPPAKGDEPTVTLDASIDDGSHKSLRFIELTSTAISDHFCAGYKESIRSYFGLDQS